MQIDLSAQFIMFLMPRFKKKVWGAKKSQAKYSREKKK